MHRCILTVFFIELEDPRQSANAAHLFTDILFLVVCASIAGTKGWEDTEGFGELHFDWFSEKGLFKNELHVHDTIARVISRVDSEQFQRYFIGWMWTDAVSRRVIRRAANCD